jgi:hypothetical protein
MNSDKKLFDTSKRVKKYWYLLAPLNLDDGDGDLRKKRSQQPSGPQPSPKTFHGLVYDQSLPARGSIPPTGHRFSGNSDVGRKSVLVPSACLTSDQTISVKH